MLIWFYTVLPPISTENLTPDEINGVVQSTRDSMLKVLEDMYKTRDEYAKTGQHTKVETPVVTPNVTATASGVEM